MFGATWMQASGSPPPPALPQRRVDRLGAVRAVRPAAQDDRVARLQAQRRGVRADIRPAFVDHADHADRGRDALDAQPVRPGPVGQRALQRVRQRGDFLQAAVPSPRPEPRSGSAGRGTPRCHGRPRRLAWLAARMSRMPSRKASAIAASAVLRVVSLLRASTWVAARAALAAFFRCSVASISPVCPNKRRVSSALTRLLQIFGDFQPRGMPKGVVGALLSSPPARTASWLNTMSGKSIALSRPSRRGAMTGWLFR